MGMFVGFATTYPLLFCFLFSPVIWLTSSVKIQLVIDYSHLATGQGCFIRSKWSPVWIAQNAYINVPSILILLVIKYASAVRSTSHSWVLDLNGVIFPVADVANRVATRWLAEAIMPADRTRPLNHGFHILLQNVESSYA